MTSSISEQDNEKALCEWYKNRTGKILDLKAPRSFNEKMQWLKLHDSTPEKTICADKYLVKDWLKGKIGAQYIIPLLGVWEHFDDIEFDKLPNSFALKANHGCGWNAIVKNKEQFDKKAAKKKFDLWMKTNFAFVWGFEMQYKNIQPKIIAEAYFGSEYEYQVWCFNGKPEFISVIASPHDINQKITYNQEWKRLPFVTSLPKLEKEIPCPHHFEDMIAICNKVAQDFIFVRVDFYLNNNCLKFGEMTFTPAGGIVHWEPQKYDDILGEILNIKVKDHSPVKNGQKLTQ